MGALIVISSSESLPSRPIGELDMWEDLKVAFRTGNFGYPQIPVLVLPHTDGTRLQQLSKQENSEFGENLKYWSTTTLAELLVAVSVWSSLLRFQAYPSSTVLQTTWMLRQARSLPQLRPLPLRGRWLASA